MATDEQPTWMCGAFQPEPQRAMEPYRCTEPHHHRGDHRADIDGETVATWPRGANQTT